MNYPTRFFENQLEAWNDFTHLLFIDDFSPQLISFAG